MGAMRPLRNAWKATRQDRPPGCRRVNGSAFLVRPLKERGDGRKRFGGGLRLGVSKRAGNTPPLPAPLRQRPLHPIP